MELLSLTLRHGAVELARYFKIVQPLPCPVERRLSTGHGLSCCRSSFLYLGKQFFTSVWRFLPHALADLSPHGLRIQIEDRTDGHEGQAVLGIGLHPAPRLVPAARNFAVTLLSAE